MRLPKPVDDAKPNQDAMTSPESLSKSVFESEFELLSNFIVFSFVNTIKLYFCKTYILFEYIFSN